MEWMSTIGQEGQQKRMLYVTDDCFEGGIQMIVLRRVNKKIFWTFNESGFYTTSQSNRVHKFGERVVIDSNNIPPRSLFSVVNF